MNFETLVVVADGGGARAFMEKVRHGPLTELASWASKAPKSERRGVGAHGGTTTSRFGHARHNVHDSSPAAAAERNFLVQLAERINQATVARQFDNLVVIAPPKALGTLRANMSPTAARCVEHTAPHDCGHETVEQLRQRLHNLRVPA
jgi:protein required for attachment to host cells